ncbi:MULTISPECIES: hypothetical protein [Methylobacterium]|uniref:hypothetical protein n=1 Tax=Methylobacterium TaxID=407 RepID=UPI0013EAEFEF|nr:hypothetical protein [Methylobacterium sp. DB0501]NGM34925.1 hypothetical protein [Methylobacterium sp. DB0501]
MAENPTAALEARLAQLAAARTALDDADSFEGWEARALDEEMGWVRAALDRQKIGVDADAGAACLAEAHPSP